MLEDLKFKELNFSYLTGRKIDITYLNDSLKGRIMHIGQNEIILLVDKNKIFENGQIIKCNLFYIDFFTEFYSTIISSNDGIITIKTPYTITKLQLRASLRVPCEIKCEIQDIAKGKITNISTGGAYVKVHNDFSNKEHVDSIKNIIFSIDNKDIKIKAKILDEGDKFLRVRFRETSEDIEDFIGKYCSKVDARIYRSGKHDR